jgi:hypothetical protein
MSRGGLCDRPKWVNNDAKAIRREILFILEVYTAKYVKDSRLQAGTGSARSTKPVIHLMLSPELVEGSKYFPQPHHFRRFVKQKEIIGDFCHVTGTVDRSVAGEKHQHSVSEYTHLD